jgi:O-antigen ligase
LTDPISKLSILGRAAYLGTALVILGSATPLGGAGEQWGRGCFVAAVAVLGVVRCIDGLAHSRFRIAEPILLLPLVGVVLLAGFQLAPFLSGKAPSLDRYETWTFMITIAALGVSFEILLHYTDTGRNLRILSALVLAIAIGSSLFGLGLELFSNSEQAIVGDATHQQQSYAQFLNRNHFALLVEMGLGLLLGILLKASLRPLQRLAGWLTVAFLSYSIVAAGSRGGVVSLVGLAIFAAFVHVMTSKFARRARELPSTEHPAPKKTLPKLVLATGLGVLVFASILVLVASIGDDQLMRRIERIDNEVGSVNQSQENRAAIWRSTIELIGERPVIGSGFGAYSVAITQFDRSNGRFVLEQAHNEYLEILANGGIVAAVLFAIFGVMVAKRTIENMRSRDKFRRACCFGSLIGIFGVMIHNTVDFGLHLLVNSLVFMVLIVIGVSRIRRPGTSA